MRAKRIWVVGSLSLATLACVVPGAIAADPKAKPDIRAALQEQLQKIRANQLAAWEQEDSAVVTEPEAKGYKILRANGAVEFAEQLPAGPAGIAKLYVRQNPPGYALVITDQGRQTVWVRLYWYADRNKWLSTHPNLAVFQIDERLSEDFLTTLNRYYDTTASYRLPIAMSALKRTNNPEERARYVAEVRELTKKLGQPWGGTALLDAVYDINMKIPTASIEEKVALAKKRRELFQAIVQKVQPKP